MSKNTSVTLGDYFERIIEKSIETGRYSSASEVIREGLRLVDERNKKLKSFGKPLKLERGVVTLTTLIQ